MPLMKVRNQDNNAWHTVDYLNFQRIGIGEITLSSDNNKIHTNTDETIAYESYVEDKIDTCMPKLLITNTKMSSTDQGKTPLTSPKGQEGQLLLEHRTLTDKNNGVFHILNYWNGTSWIPLNNIWG